jgi:hypothetical protein
MLAGDVLNVIAVLCSNQKLYRSPPTGLPPGPTLTAKILLFDAAAFRSNRSASYRN